MHERRTFLPLPHSKQYLTPNMKLNRPTARRSRNAFTLMEMMLVLAIIALLIAVGAVTLRNVGEQAEITTAQAQINSIKTVIQSYKNHNRKYPAKLEELVTPPANAKMRKSYIGEDGITDPWGEKFQMRSPGKKSGEAFDIYSMGPDKRDGTEDDVYP